MTFAMFLALVMVSVFNVVLLVVMTRPRNDGVADQETDDERPQ